MGSWPIVAPTLTHHQTVGLIRARIRTSGFGSLVVNSQHMRNKKRASRTSLHCSQGWNGWQGRGTSPFKRHRLPGQGAGIAWAGALHANRVSSSWKVQRFHMKSQWLGLPQGRGKRPSYLNSPRKCLVPRAHGRSGRQTPLNAMRTRGGP